MAAVVGAVVLESEEEGEVVLRRPARWRRCHRARAATAGACCQKRPKTAWPTALASRRLRDVARSLTAMSVGTRWCGALRIRRPRLRSAATHARRTLRTQRISCGLATRGSSAILHPATVGRSTPGTGTDLALLALAPDKRAPLSLRTARRVHGRVSTSARECAQDWPNAGRLTAQPLGADARAMDGRRAGRRGGRDRQMGDRTRRHEVVRR